MSGLPAITDAVMIDGTTEPDFAGLPVVKLNGSNAGDSDGLTIDKGSYIRGLVINGFGNAGIDINGSGGSVIVGNFIGTDHGRQAAVDRRRPQSASDPEYGRPRVRAAPGAGGPGAGGPDRSDCRLPSTARGPASPRAFPLD